MSENTYEVAVVGAGFAGAVAARDLSLAGLSVVHLEARDRIGGRTYYGEAFGRSVDFGGTYVHWTQPHAWHELRRYGLELARPMPTERVYWLAHDEVYSADPVEYHQHAAPLVERFIGDARAAFPYPFSIQEHGEGADAVTVRERLDSLDLTTYDRDLLGGAISSLVHDEDQQGMGQFLFWTALQMGSWDNFLEVAGGWPIVGGTQRLLGAIIAESRARLVLGAPVTAVDDDGSVVIVTTGTGEQIQVRQVVVAAPLNTLSDISFTPELPPTSAGLIARKQPMRTRKIWVRVKGEVQPFSASAPAGKHPISTARVEYRHEGDSLVVCFCSDADALDPTDMAAVEKALQLFVPDLEVVDTACHDWVADPFSQGTWAHHRPGDLTGSVPYLREAHGRIRFAGGDVAPLGVGGIEGAIETGAEAARQVIAELRG